MSVPWVWTASTAYTPTAVIIPTAFGGYTWRCTTGGTSGLVEPAWPADPSVTPTVNDGTVVWSVGTGFRQALQAGFVTIATTFMNANPTLLRQVRTVRPRSLTNVDLPCLFLGDLNESVSTGQGLRTRTFGGFSAFYVDFLGEQAESNDRLNFAADAFADYWTASYHMANGRSIFTHSETRDTEFNEGGVIYPALEFVFAPTSVMEGRI